MHTHDQNICRCEYTTGHMVRQHILLHIHQEIYAALKSTDWFQCYF